MQAARAWWLRIHRWLGIVVGAAFVLLGLTGSALVFRYEIEESLHPELLLTRHAGPWRPPSEAVAAAVASKPEGGVLRWVGLPRTPRGIYLVGFDVPATDGRPARLVEVIVDPHTSRVRGARVWGEYLTTWIYDLHYTLRLGRTGERVAGVLGALLALSLVSGLCLWMPVVRSRGRRAFTLRRHRGSAARSRELHYIAGAYAAMPLLLTALTGVYMEFSAPAHAALGWIAPMTPWPEGVRSAAPGPGGRMIPVEDAMRIARRTFPEGEVKYALLPDGPRGVYQVNLRQPGEAYKSLGRTDVWIDAYSAAVLERRDPRAFTAGDRVDEWIFPLHTGEGFGTPSRWIVFVGGLVPLVLYVSGIRMWLRKRAGRHRRRIRGEGVAGLLRQPAADASPDLARSSR